MWTFFVHRGDTHHFCYFGRRVSGTLIVFRVASVSGRHVATNFSRLMARSSKANLVPAIVQGVTCFLRRFAVYGRGSAAELAVESWSSGALWRLACCHTATIGAWRHLQNLSVKVVLSGGTAMIQGINEHVANDLTELFPQLENKEVAASPERKYSLMSRRIHLVLCLHFPSRRKSTSNLAQQCPQKCFKVYDRMLTLSVAWYTSVTY